MQKQKKTLYINLQFNCALFLERGNRYSTQAAIPKIIITDPNSSSILITLSQRSQSQNNKQ
jgi:hypothetical protein